MLNYQSINLSFSQSLSPPRPFVPFVPLFPSFPLFPCSLRPLCSLCSLRSLRSRVPVVPFVPFVPFVPVFPLFPSFPLFPCRRHPGFCLPKAGQICSLLPMAFRFLSAEGESNLFPAGGISCFVSRRRVKFVPLPEASRFCLPKASQICSLPPMALRFLSAKGGSNLFLAGGFPGFVCRRRVKSVPVPEASRF